MEYFYSKYTGEELEERLDRIEDIPELLAEMLTGKNYTTPEDALCIVKKYVPTIYENIPIDNNTIYWDDTNDGRVLKARVQSSTNGDGGNNSGTGTGQGCLWEKKVDSKGNLYLYSTLPVVTQYGITMYAGTEGLNIGGIYDGLPIDNATIYWGIDSNGNKVLKALGGSSGGGVADSVAWANVVGKPTWLLDDKISYSEITGTPDLSKFVTRDLDERITGIKSFINGLKIGESLIKQLQEDVIYIDANLVVRGGVTMYYDNGEIDIPAIKDQIGNAGYSTKGLASFDQNYFIVNDGHVSLIEDAVGLNEDELLNYLTSNQYAKKSDIPSLSGYATQSWVESKGFALNSDLTALSTKVNDFLEGSDTDNIINKWKELEAFLTGLDGSNDLATILSWKADKTYVDETFVTIGGDTEQTITGPKNFTGGLKVNGSPIYYDTENKYWKLEGDLLVTGGVTMYGNEGTFIPSTIMGAIAVDGTTISKEGGILKVIGDLSGGATTLGSLTNVGSWADSVASQDRIMYQAANSSQWVAKNLSDLTVGGVTGDYLPLSGGTMTGTINTQFIRPSVNAAYQCGTSSLRWDNVYSVYGNFSDSVTINGNTAWHAGNDGSGSGLDADLLDGKHLRDIIRYEGRNDNGNDAASAQTITYWGEGNWGHGYTYGTSLNIQGADSWNHRLDFRTDGVLDYYQGINTGAMTHIGTIAFTSSNVASATKLQTARTIWGQSFDGTGDIEGAFRLIFPNIPGDAHVIHSALKYKENPYGLLTRIYNDGAVSLQVQRESNVNEVFTLLLNPHGGNVGIGTTNPSAKLHVAGDILATGGITMYSARKLKNITDERGLSLEELSVIKPTRFTWKDGRDDKVHIGGIADDVMKVLPEVIYKTGEDDTLTMDYGNAAFAIAASLIKPVVNHEERIRLLEEENKRLKEEVEQLKWNIA